MARKVFPDQRREYVRYYCVECDSRVYPYDSFEIRTVAPQASESGNEVLIHSLNAQRSEKNENRMAYCWNQHKWVTARRETKSDFLLRYLKRKGVTLRLNERTMAGQMDELETIRQERQNGAGVIHLPKKKRAS